MLAEPTTEIDKLVTRLEAELAGQQLIDEPMADECELVVVVPVRGEHIERLLKQLESLIAQDVDLRRLEVILVVNNRPDNHSEGWRVADELNSSLLETPMFRNRSSDGPGIFTTMRARFVRDKLAVYVIDQSSYGKQVEDSNVGRARQRGLLEVVLRFARKGRNGLVFHTDADCWFDDPSLIFKLLWLFEHNADIKALGGHYTLEIDPQDEEAEELFAALPAYKRYQCYHELFRDIRRGSVGRTEVQNTLGRCIVHRAFEGYEVGGFKPLAIYEDFEFCVAFEQRGMQIVWGHKLNIRVTSAFRISDRTPSSIREELGRVGTDTEHLVVEDAFNSGQTVLLDDSYMERLVAAVRVMPGSAARLEYIFLHSPVMCMRVKAA